MKKLLTTTALVALVSSVAFADAKVGGSLEVTITDAETASTGAKRSKGTAIGYEHEIDMSASKELDNGWKSTIHSEGINDDATAGLIDDVSLKVSNGDTTLYVGQDDMTAFDINMAPKVYELVEDNATQATIINSGDGTIHDTNAFGISQKVGEGAITFLYSPDTAQDSGNGDNTVGSGGGSGYEIGYSGSVAGVKFGVAYAEDKPTVDTGGQTGESTIVTASYSMDALSVGFSVTDDDNAGTTDDVKTTYITATYAVNDKMSVGIQRVTGKDSDAAETEEVTQLDVGYDLGGLLIYAYHSQASDVGGVANTDADGWGIKLKQSF